MKNLTDATFKTDIKKNQDAVFIVDFWAEWCMPCRALTPLIESIAEEMKENKKIVFAKLNVDENQMTSAEMGISSIPNVKAFFKGEEIGEFIGLRDEEFISEFVEKMMEKAGV